MAGADLNMKLPINLRRPKLNLEIHMNIKVVYRFIIW